MNTPTTSQPTPDLESLHKAVLEFRPNPHRVPFNNLKPFHDSIATLRDKQASYSMIAELLQQNGVKASRARVAEYGRIVLDGGKSRKWQKYACPKSTMLQSEPLAPKPVPHISAPTFQPAIKPERGPHIARIRLLDGPIAGGNNFGQVS